MPDARRLWTAGRAATRAAPTTLGIDRLRRGRYNAVLVGLGRHTKNCGIPNDPQ